MLGSRGRGAKGLLAREARSAMLCREGLAYLDVCVGATQQLPDAS